MERSKALGQNSSVLVMAAGQGTRMKSATPKVLHELLGRTLLGHAMHAAAGISPKQMIVVVRHDRDKVAAAAEGENLGAFIADQDEIPGTGRAVQCGLEQALAAGLDLGETVVVTSGDVPLLETATLQAVLDQHHATGAAVTPVTAYLSDPTGYGRVVRDPADESLALRFVEHKDATPAELAITEGNMGIYAFDTEFLLQTLGQLGQDNAQGEVYLTDLVAAAAQTGRKAVPFVLDDPWQVTGCNDLEQLAELRAHLNYQLARRHMLAGVSVIDPATTSFDVQVTIAPDAVIEPGTQLGGETHIDRFAVVGPGTTLENVRVGAGARVPHAALRNIEIGEGEAVEPFTVRSGNPRRADQ